MHPGKSSHRRSVSSVSSQARESQSSSNSHSRLANTQVSHYISHKQTSSSDQTLQGIFKLLTVGSTFSASLHWSGGLKGCTLHLLAHHHSQRCWLAHRSRCHWQVARFVYGHGRWWHFEDWEPGIARERVRPLITLTSTLLTRRKHTKNIIGSTTPSSTLPKTQYTSVLCASYTIAGISRTSQQLSQRQRGGWDAVWITSVQDYTIHIYDIHCRKCSFGVPVKWLKLKTISPERKKRVCLRSIRHLGINLTKFR